MKRLVVATGNAGKLREFTALLAPLGIEPIPQSHFNVSAAPEPHRTFIENALEKARHAAKLTGLPAMADDSGICVAALGGAPGVRSARYACVNDGDASNDTANNAKLIATLRGQANRSAHYYAALVLVRTPDDPEPLIAEGRWFGDVVDAPRGAGGFGYDPHFYLNALQRTAAELSPDEKNRVSHRAQALQKLVAMLEEQPL